MGANKSSMEDQMGRKNVGKMRFSQQKLKQNKPIPIPHSSDKHRIGQVFPVPVLIGISGATRSGKTSLAETLTNFLRYRSNLYVCQVSQDNYFNMRWIAANNGNWEAEAALDHNSFAVAVEEAMQSSLSPDVVIVEGFQAFHDPDVVEKLDLAIWLDCEEETIRARRMRTKRVPDGYFDNVLWPCHLRHREMAFRNLLLAKNSRRLDGESAPDKIFQAAMELMSRVLGVAQGTRVLSNEPSAAPRAGGQSGTLSSTTCSPEALERIASRARSVPSTSRLVVLLLPGSLNPAHRDHVRCLVRAREQLQLEGMIVLAGFLQPSSDRYVLQKLGSEAMSLTTRVQVCDLTAASDDTCARERWIETWCSGSVNGSHAAMSAQRFLSIELGRDIFAYTVCGADFVVRCGGWAWDRRGGNSPEMVVVPRIQTQLPAHAPPAGSGWHIADDLDGDIPRSCSSTKIRKHVAAEEWEALVEYDLTTQTVASFLRDRYNCSTGLYDAMPSKCRG